MAANDAPGRGPGWQARPKGAFFVRLAVVLVPVLAGVAAGVTVTRLARPRTNGDLLLLWVASFVVSNVVLFGLARQARRLLPLAALLELSLTFPDRTPSRVGVALRAGNLKAKDKRAHALLHARSANREEAIQAVLALAAALSTHDKGTRGHSERVRAYTELLGDELHLPVADKERLRWASLLHDVGKMAVPAGTLNKPGALDDDEWAAVKQHPVHGAELVTALEPWLGEWAAVVAQHHERWDGGGYPHGMSGNAIHRGARMVAVADAFEVMTAARPYKKPLPAAEARRRLAEGAGTQFDPGMVRAFLNVGLGRLRLVTGPLAWLAQVPFLRRLDLVTRAPAQVALGSIVTAAAVSAAVATLPSQLDQAPRIVAAPVARAPYANGDTVTVDLAGAEPGALSPLAPLAAAPSSAPASSQPPPASTLPILTTADPPAAPAPTPPSPEPTEPPPTSPPPQPAPTPLVQVNAEIEPVDVGLAVGVGDGGCTGVTAGDSGVGCPPAETGDAPVSADVGVVVDPLA